MTGPSVAEPGIDVRRHGKVAVLEIVNPARRNALTPGMLVRLTDAVRAADLDPETVAIELTGHGDTFCSGLDLRSWNETGCAPDGLARQLEAVLLGTDTPTVAILRGHVVGAGCQLALACDVRLADPTARFAITPARVGLVYPPSSMKRLIAVVGETMARFLLLTASSVDAHEALRTGLVTTIHPTSELDAAAAGTTDRFGELSRLSVTATKQILNGCAEGAGDDELDHLHQRWSALSETCGELAAGRVAFARRRPTGFPWRPPMPGIASDTRHEEES